MDLFVTTVEKLVKNWIERLQPRRKGKQSGARAKILVSRQRPMVKLYGVTYLQRPINLDLNNNFFNFGYFDVRDGSENF